MGRPINKQTYLGTVGTTSTPVKHQIQATIWGAKDSSATAGYLTRQNSPHRFRSTTVNGTSVTTLVNGSGNLVSGTAYVKVFPAGTIPTVVATGSATLKAIGNANVVSGGTGYQPGDYITLVGGTYSAAANVQVLTVSGANAITSLSTPVNFSYGTQKYTALPSNIAGIATANATGNGTGAIVSFNFGVDTAAVLTGGAGYVQAEMYINGATVAPTFANLAVSGGAVTVNANVVVSAPGVVNVNPVVVIQGDNPADVEYVKTMTSMNYLNTYQGNQYRWISKGGTIPSDWSGLGVKLAYLDTL